MNASKQLCTQYANSTTDIFWRNTHIKKIFKMAYLQHPSAPKSKKKLLPPVLALFWVFV
jgi:hypothetical protein